MGALLERAADEQRLLEAWAELRRRSGEPTEASRGIARFAANPAQRIAVLSRQLASGTWSPGPLTSIAVPKSAGGTRRLAVPTVADRIVERSILWVIDPIVDAELLPWSFAYRRGLGVGDAIGTLVEARDDGLEAVVRLDIEDCFDHVGRAETLRSLRDVIDDDGLLRILRRIIYRAGPRGGRARSRGVPQGAPLSPLLANLFLNAFDRALLSEGHRVVRFADDIAIPVRDARVGEEVLALATSALRTMGLRARRSKSGIAQFVDGVPFCGEVITSGTGVRPQRSERPLATSVYVTREGTLLRTRNGRLVVETPNEDPWRISLERVRQIIVFGRVGITTPLLHRLLEHETDVVLLSNHGRYFGRITGATKADPFLREAQYRCATSTEESMRFSRTMIAGKLSNQRTVLLRSPTRHDAGVVRALRHLDEARRRCSSAQTQNELMGVEGAAAREYFAALGIILRGAGFTSRRRRPPPDPVNSALSFGYTLLVNEIQGAVEASGLDPYRGFLHQPRVGRPSLALDLVEEWRPVLVDWVVVSMFLSGRLAADDFETVPSGESELCRLTNNGRPKFLAAYEKRLLTLFTHEPTGRRVSYRVGLSLQSALAARAVRIDPTSYRSVVWK